MCAFVVVRVISLVLHFSMLYSVRVLILWMHMKIVMSHAILCVSEKYKNLQPDLHCCHFIMQFWDVQCINGSLSSQKSPYFYCHLVISIALPTILYFNSLKVLTVIFGYLLFESKCSVTRLFLIRSG